MGTRTTKSGVGKDAFRWELRSDLAALAELRATLRDYLAQHAVSSAAAADVILSLQEAAKNAMRAGGGRPVSVSVWIKRDTINVRVRDHGAGFSVSAPRRCPRAWQTGGRGLYVMRTLMDSVDIDCSNGAMVLMRRRLSGSAAA